MLGEDDAVGVAVQCDSARCSSLRSVLRGANRTAVRVLVSWKLSLGSKRRFIAPPPRRPADHNIRAAGHSQEGSILTNCKWPNLTGKMRWSSTRFRPVLTRPPRATCLAWLGGTIDFDRARKASYALLSAIHTARDDTPDESAKTTD